MNPVLLAEYRRNIDLASPEATALLDRLEGQANVFIPSAEAIARVQPFFGAASWADALHAATCYGVGAALISNDDDFTPLAESGLVPVLTAGQALRRFGLS